jgi:hypothetical protein
MESTPPARRKQMAMDTGKRKEEPHESVADQAHNMVDDISSEIKHEASRIHAIKAPVDSTQSDHVVRRHVTGLSITFFALIGLFLIAAIAAIVIGGTAMFGHH